MKLQKRSRRDLSANGSLASVPAKTDDLPEGYPTVLQKYTSCRWRLTYMLISGISLVQLMLNSMGFAVVCMTRPTIPVESTEVNNTSWSLNTTDFANKNATVTETTLRAEFDYSSETQGLLISSVFYAGILSPMIGSFTSRKFGPKRVTLIAMLIGGVVMLLFPIAARTHLYLAVLCRIIIGLTGNTPPAVSFDFWLRWAPQDEKAQLIAYCFSGPNIANVITFVTSGYLCLIPVDNGWPFIFYVFGSCAVLWCLVWQLVVYESPENHPGITDSEKKYIQAKGSKVDDHPKKRKIPWKSIACTDGVWAFFIVQFCHAWNSSVVASYLPSYMASVLKFDVDKNGLLSSLPYVTRVLGVVGVSHISVHILKVLSVTHTRKLIQTCGFFIAAGLAVSLCYLEEGQEYIAVAIFTISTPFQGATLNAALVTPFDMAPQYASIITSGGMACALAGLMSSPIAVSYIIVERTREQWSYVFYMCAGIYVFAAVVFLILGNGKLQPWAEVSGPDSRIVDSGELGSGVLDSTVLDSTEASERSIKNGQINVAYVATSDEVTRM